MLSRSAFTVLRRAVSALSSTSAKKAVRLVRLQSEYHEKIYILLLFISVSRYLVYNLRKRGGDSADKYFKSTELIAGVKDMRFQALMPDVLHWLGIKKIDNMVSMSDMFVTHAQRFHFRS